MTRVFKGTPRSSIKALPDKAILEKLLTYDPATGEIWRKEQSPSDFKTKAAYMSAKARSFNKVAGSKAGNYIIITLLGESYSAHRLAWKMATGSEPKDCIDHINGDKHDNRLCNLREASNAENKCNQPPQKNNTTGFKGVSEEKGGGYGLKVFKASIRYKGTLKNLGRYETPELAHIAYCKAAQELQGTFARVL